MNVIGSRAIQAAIQAGNVNIAGAMQTEEMELSSASKAEVALHGEALRRLEAQKRARSMVVPTAIDDVKLRLRELGHPITMFGEGHFDRRERLKMVLAQIDLDAEASSKGGIIIGSSIDLQEQQLHSQQQLQRQKKEIVYTHASEELAQARSFLCDFSFPRARARLDARRRLFDEVQPPESASSSRESADSATQALYSHCQNLVLGASAAAQDRPLVCVRVSPSGALLATGSLGTSVRLWDAQNLVERDSGLRAHEERIMSLAWHPSAGLESDAPEILASCAADGLCVLWDCRAASQESSGGMDVVEPAVGGSGSGGGGGRELRRLTGHVGPVADCCFHPSGRYVGTAGHDNTWRLWEAETGKELLLQDGHAKECSALAFQCDGALCLTGDAAGVALLWDLRSGQAVHACQGHVGKISSVAFSPNGFQAASSSVDNTVRIWDFRRRKCSGVLPAHGAAITEVRYSPSGEALLTSSFDASLKLWGARDHRLLRTMLGHSGKVMSADFMPDERFVVSAGFDRTIKLWSHR